MPLDQDIYLIASQELERGEINNALWAKAEFLADNHPENTKFEYIKLRVEQLKNEPPKIADRHMDQTEHQVNYVVRHWKGGNTLSTAYWVNGIGVSLAVLLLITVISESSMLSDAFWLVIMLLALIVSVWSWVGIWRSSTNYIDSARIEKNKGYGWAYAARLSVILGVIQAVPIYVDTFAILGTLESDINTQYYVEQVATTDLKLTGYINDSSVESVLTAFRDNPDLTALIINSPGGFLESAFKLADFIEENGILVGVQERCFSACFLLFAASNTSIATPNSEIAFHHPEATVEFISQDLVQAGIEQDAEYYARFLRYGISQESLNDFREAGWVNLSLGEIHSLGILDLIWILDGNQFHSPIDYCNLNNCFTIPVSSRLDPVVGVMDLEIGNCFNDDGVTEATDGSSLVQLTLCTQEHDNEVISKFELEGEEFPGDDISDISLLECLPYFSEYVGQEYLDSSLDIFVLPPTEASWSLGDKVVLCVAFNENLEKLVMTVKDSAF